MLKYHVSVLGLIFDSGNVASSGGMGPPKSAANLTWLSRALVFITPGFVPPLMIQLPTATTAH